MNIQVQKRSIYKRVQHVCKLVLSVNGAEILEAWIAGDIIQYEEHLLE